MIENKRAYFEQSTRVLLERLDNMKLDKMSRIRAKSITRAIRDAMLKIPVQVSTFKITPYQCSLCYDSLGFCRVASLAFINMMSEHNHLTTEWNLYVYKYGEDEHHFLKHGPDGEIFDLTFDQFTVERIVIPYETGHKTNIGVLDKNDPVYDFYEAAGFNESKPLNLPFLITQDR